MHSGFRNLRGLVLGLGGLALFMAVLGGCRSADPSDQVLDRLEQAIARLEASVAEGRAAKPERLGAELVRALAERGSEVQAIYAETQTLGEARLSNEQLKRRDALTERAVLAVGDMLNLRLAEPQP